MKYSGIILEVLKIKARNEVQWRGLGKEVQYIYYYRTGFSFNIPGLNIKTYTIYKVRRTVHKNHIIKMKSRV